MKVYIEFTTFETRDKIREQLDKKGFKTSLNSMGTLFISNVKNINYKYTSFSLECETKEDKYFYNNCYELYIEDVDYMEIQK